MLNPLSRPQEPIGTLPACRFGGRTWARFDRETGGLLRRAQDCAQRLRHDVVRSAHLLLAALADPDVVEVLLRSGVTPSEVTQAVAAVEPPAARPVFDAWLPLAADTREAMWCALEEAHGLGHGAMRAPHVLVGMLRVGDCTAGRLLDELGATVEGLRLEVLENAAARDDGLGAA